MSDNVSIRYALRLPNGELAHDVRREFLCGYPKSEVLPNGAIALLWGEDEAHHVSQTRAALADEVSKWGLDELLKEQSMVVKVRTTVEILDPELAGDPVVDHEVVEDEPRTWRRAQDIPMGVRFVPAAGNRHYKRVLNGARTVNLDPFTEGHHYGHQSLNEMHPEGFSEVRS
ncbi:hypothetical protein [Nocardia flavorosea]|uniref:Uncharacterized protein n=1 Tax=Nocardia flavorosea TaxID=53429 RepID=A0A846YT06_9NOCA|nr:hypothetical protein [Nocardia flavorosea]NKY60412.1 hypothetical protein [Nocardia flavorosea]